MRIIFFGSGEFGLPTLRALHEAHGVRLIVTQPDRPAGRRRRLAPTPIARWAEEHAPAIPLIKPERVNRPEIVQRVREADPEANVVVAFGQKVGGDLIASPAHGPAATMNLHASLLPKYRGAAPIHRAILGGERTTGNTVFSLVDRMDAGDILGRQETPIDSGETAGELHDRLAAMGPDLVLDVLRRLEAGDLHPEPQDDAQASPAPKLSRADGVVDFTQPAEHVRRRVHGLTPWPGVRCWWSADEGDERHVLLLRRVEAMPNKQHDAQPGRMIEDGVIATGQGAIRLLEVQPPGKRAMSWSEFARGHQVKAGAVFFDRQES